MSNLPLAGYPIYQPFKPALTPGGVPVHSGVDIAAPKGTPFTLPYNGVVTAVGADPVMGYDYGNYFEVKYDGGYYAFGAHLNWYPLVRVGDRITANKTDIGYVGDTGLSFGDHLHYSIFKKHLDRTTAIDPETYTIKAGTGSTATPGTIERRMRTTWLG